MFANEGPEWIQNLLGVHFQDPRTLWVTFQTAERTEQKRKHYEILACTLMMNRQIFQLLIQVARAGDSAMFAFLQMCLEHLGREAGRSLAKFANDMASGVAYFKLHARTSTNGNYGTTGHFRINPSTNRIRFKDDAYVNNNATLKSFTTIIAGAMLAPAAHFALARKHDTRYVSCLQRCCAEIAETALRGEVKLETLDSQPFHIAERACSGL